MWRIEAIPLPDEQSESAPNPLADKPLLNPAAAVELTDSPLGESLRRVNMRFFSVLLAVSGALAVSLFLLHTWQMQSMENRFLDQAGIAQRDGEHGKAIRLLQRHLRIVPGDLIALTDLAFLLHETAETPREKQLALLSLERALRYKPDRADVRRKVIQISMHFGRYRDAIEHLKFLLSTLPDDGDSQLLLAKCYEFERQFDDAVEAYEAAYQAAPSRLELYGRLAMILSDELNRPERAREILQEMISRNRNSYRAYLVRARFLRDHGRVKSAASDLKIAYRLAPQEPGVLVLVAELMLDHASSGGNNTFFDPLELQRRLKQALRDRPGNKRLIIATALFDLKAGRADTVEEQLRGALRIHRDDQQLTQLLADVLIYRGKLDAARQELSRLRTENKLPAVVTYLEARLAMVGGEYLAASRKLETIRSQAPSRSKLMTTVNLHLSLCYEKLGQPERRLAACRRAVKLDELSIGARLGLAQSLTRIGRFDDALSHYRQMTSVPGVPLEIARVILFRTLNLAEEERKWDEVGQALNAAAADKASLVDVILLRASVQLAQERLGVARQILEGAVKRHPGFVRLWIARATLEVRSGNAGAAQSLLEEAERNLGRRIELVRTRIQLAASFGDAAKAREILAQLEEIVEDFVPELQEPLVRALARAFERIGDADQSERLWRRAALLQPDFLETWRRLLGIALRSAPYNDKADGRAINLLAEIRRIEGDGGLYWRLGEAARQIVLARSGRPARLGEAKRQLVAIAKELPAPPMMVSLSLAEIYELEGNEDYAIEHYLTAIDLGLTNQRIVYHVVELLNRRRQYVDAQKVIRKFWRRSQSAFSRDFGRLASTLSIRAGDFQQAIQLARQTAETEPDDYRHLLWLGQALASAGQPQEAEASLREAVQLDVTQSQPWVALVYFLSRTGAVKQALETIAEAQQHLSLQADPLAFAQCYETVGRLQQAERSYQAALQAALEQNPPDNVTRWLVASFYLRSGKTAQAEPILRSLIETESKPAAPIRRAARRALALVLMSRKGFAEFREAMDLIEQNAGRLGAAAEDISLKARLLASRPTQRNRREAIAMLEALDERISLTAADQFQLAKLHLANNSFSQARDTMVGLLAAHAEQTDFLAFGVRMTLARGEVEGTAADWLQTLIRLKPAAFQTLELRVRSLIAHNRLEEAVSLFEKDLEGEQYEPRELAFRRQSAAAALAELARKFEVSGRPTQARQLADYAETLYRTLYAQDRSKVLLLIRFLKQRHELKEAVALCAGAWKHAPPESVAIACVDLLRSGTPAPELFRQVETWLQAACRDHPESAEFVFQLANTAHLKGDYRVAESLYRQAAEMSPRAVFAYNDLALLLALQGVGLDEALESIDKAIGISGPLPFLLDTRASVHLAAGRNRLAIQDLEDSIAEAPGAAAYFHLAQAHVAAGDETEAKRALSRGLARGLHAGTLHPLERRTYEQIKRKLQKF